MSSKGKKVVDGKLDRVIAKALDTAGNTVSGLDYPQAHGVANQLWAWAADRRRRADHLDGRHPGATPGCIYCGGVAA